VKSQRPKVGPIRQPTLFQMEKLENAAELTSQFKIERPFSPQTAGKAHSIQQV